MERKRISQVEWKNNKMTEVKHKIKPKTTKPVLSDPDNKKNLEELYTKIVIVPIIKHQTVWHLYAVNITVPNY